MNPASVRAGRTSLTCVPSQVAAILAIIYLAATPAALAAGTCDDTEVSEARSLTTLPDAIRKLLPARTQGLGGIADRGAAFNSTDMLDPRLPVRRFVLAAIAKDCVVIAVESGGWRRRFELTEYHLVNAEWQLTSHDFVSQEPSSAADLLRAARNLPAPPADQ